MAKDYYNWSKSTKLPELSQETKKTTKLAVNLAENECKWNQLINIDTISAFLQIIRLGNGPLK